MDDKLVNKQILSHYEGFEKEKEYMEIWDSIRYKKLILSNVE